MSSTAHRSCTKVTITSRFAGGSFEEVEKIAQPSARATFLAANDALDSETFECVHLGSAFLAPENGLESNQFHDVSNTFLYGYLIIHRNHPFLGFSGLLQLCFTAPFSSVSLHQPTVTKVNNGVNRVLSSLILGH